MGRLIIILFIALGVYLWTRPQKASALFRRIPPAVWMLLAVLYLVSPIDLIPDVPPFGFLDDILVLISAIWWASQVARGAQPRRQQAGRERTRQRPPESGQSGVRWDPYAVLGVARGASSAEITQAYREQMKRYHPDRVADLGEELQRVAHEKTVEIQRAYEELK